MVAARSLLWRRVAPAVLAGAFAVTGAAQATPAADAVLAQCARLFDRAPALVQDIDAIAGLTRLPDASLEPGSDAGAALRMALAWSTAIQSILGSILVTPTEELSRAHAAILADGPWMTSHPGQGGGVAAWRDAAGHLIVVERAITTGRQGRRQSRCLFIAPPGADPLIPALPEPLAVTATPSASDRGFSVVAVQGRIPLTQDGAGDAHAGFSMVTMPVPPGTPVADLARIGGVTIFRQGVSNRRSE